VTWTIHSGYGGGPGITLPIGPRPPADEIRELEASIARRRAALEALRRKGWSRAGMGQLEAEELRRSHTAIVRREQAALEAELERLAKMGSYLEAVE
jgi:hypothetical protein